MTSTIREWRNEEWEHGDKGRDQRELQRMAKDILANAETVENEPAPGYSKEDLSRCYIATSSLVSGLKYIIHMNGFTVEDIVEILQH